MHRRTRKLSIDDQKAIDVVLDHAALGGKAGLTRVTAPVAHRRLTAATKVLALLSELPEIEPPADLVARTMARIDKHTSASMEHQLARSVSTATNLH